MFFLSENNLKRATLLSLIDGLDNFGASPINAHLWSFPRMPHPDGFL